jgi:hypothetical protein
MDEKEGAAPATPWLSMSKEAQIEWFLARVEKSDGCWVWNGPRHKSRRGVLTYGRIRVGRAPVGTHRISYELFKGEIPKGLVVRHKCDNPPCVNPDHLELGTHKDNQYDAIERGRHVATMKYEDVNWARGERQGSAKFTEDDIRAIREKRAKGMSTRALGEEYGVRDSHISMITLRQIWKHVP